MSKVQPNAKEQGAEARAAKYGAREGASPGNDIETLTNSLRFEREKNEVLLGEVVALEDELVNRQLEDFEAVVSDQTRDFWREQLLSNREAATAALTELRQARAAEPGTRRPLHNRHTARPAPAGLPGRPAEGDNTAAKIRNRAHELCKTERIPFSTAFRRAEMEIVGD